MRSKAPVVKPGVILVAAAALLAPAVHASDMSWEAVTVDDLVREHAAQGRDYLRFLDRPSMSAGLYVLQAGATDPQGPHELDEVYWILEGRAVLEVGEDSLPVEAGSIAYVRAHESHRFVDIAEDLTVLVVFSKEARTNWRMTPVGEIPPWIQADLSDLRRHARSDKQVWHPLVDVESMRLWINFLPQSLGGSEIDISPMDEIHLVVSGQARLNLGDDDVDVGPGSIVFVDERVRHWYSDLDGDLEVLILEAAD